MIDIDNQTDLIIPINKIKEITKYLITINNKDKNSSVELIIVDSETIQFLNKEFRNIDKETDVLSFPLSLELHSSLLGSIIICDKFVKNGSLIFNHSIDDEFQLLYIHGILHLLGFDHEQDNGEMRDKEREIIQKFNLPNSLIVRND